MKNKIISVKIISLILLSVFVLSLASCTEGGIRLNGSDGNSTADVIVFSYKCDTGEKAELKSGLYAFILSDKKTDFLYLLSQYQEQGGSEITVIDNEEFWNTVPDKEDGRNYKELVETDIFTYCKRLVVTKALCKKYGISVTKNEETKKMIEESVQNHINAYGDENSLNSYLYRFGITADDLFDYYEMQYMVEALENYYYGTGGKTPIETSLVTEKFKEDYAKVKHIFISYTDPKAPLPEESKDDTSKDDNNKVIFDGIRTKEKVVEFAEKLFLDIKDEKVSFDEKFKLSEDGVSKHFPDGLIVQRGTSDEALDKAIFEMKIDDIVMVQGETGVYIINKIGLSENDIDEYYEGIEQTFIDERYAKIIGEYGEFVTVNNDELKKYDIVTADLYVWGDK